MIHNGIEYAEMQLLAELYALASCTMSHDEIQKTLSQWNATKSKSYLLEITASLLKYREGETPFIELIRDQASNKGTGAWATASATALGYPNSLMAAALHARYLSFFKKERVHFSKHFDNPKSTVKISSAILKNAYDLSRWINHHQGFEMLTLAAKEYKWTLDLSQVASVWAEGCIIKSDLMNDCIKLLQDNTMLLLSEGFKEHLNDGKENLKELLQRAVTNEIPIPCMQSAWTYFAALKTQNSSANIIQAQRDYFGAHGFLRTDNDLQDLVHGPWCS
jgi:6-phosphogluconate dehydrogenase